MAQYDLAREFYLHAHRVESQSLTVLTGATVHFQPYEINDSRRFLRARAFGI